MGGYVDAASGRVTFGAWFERWFATTVDLRPSTRARDETYARVHLLPRFGSVPLAKLDHLALRAWVADLSASGLAPATVVKAAQIMGKVLRSAVTGGLVAASPADDLALPRVERDEMRFLGPTEVATLADVIDERYRAMVLLAANGGLR
ncbi:MAG: site-specific integrase, partial [Acidimicrobiia bacterium]|nr:site-specific integrase [Acidimicrobiia bacterium]